jgi:hypothetical protein
LLPEKILSYNLVGIALNWNTDTLPWLMIMVTFGYKKELPCPGQFSLVCKKGLVQEIEILTSRARKYPYLSHKL